MLLVVRSRGRLHLTLLLEDSYLNEGDRHHDIMPASQRAMDQFCFSFPSTLPIGAQVYIS